MFRLLTFDNLCLSLDHGCLLLVLTVDCELDAENKLRVLF